MIADDVIEEVVDPPSAIHAASDLGPPLVKPTSPPHSPGATIIQPNSQPGSKCGLPSIVPPHQIPMNSLVGVPVANLIPNSAIAKLKPKRKSRRVGHLASISQFDHRILSRGLSGRVSMREVKMVARLQVHSRPSKKGSSSRRSTGHSLSGVGSNGNCYALKVVPAEVEAAAPTLSVSKSSGSEACRQMETVVGFNYTPVPHSTPDPGSSLSVSTHD